jgi:thiol-disulfide isomerase/thioredoxin
MAKLTRGKSFVGATLTCFLGTVVLSFAWAQNPPSGDSFSPKPDANRAQLKAHIEKLKRLPIPARTQGYGQGMVSAAEKILADSPPETLRSFAALSLMEGLHHQSAVESNADADPKLAEAAQKYQSDADKKVAAAAAFYVVEAKIVKSDDVDPAQLPALLTELKTAMKGKRPDAKYKRLATATAKAIDRLTETDQKEKEFKEFGKLFSTSVDKELVEYGNKMKSLQLVGVATADSKKEPATTETDWVGKTMVLAGKTADGKQFDIAAYKGKVVLVDFWATWCGPCKALIPHVKETYAKHHDKGFEVVGVSLDKDLNALRTYIVQEQLPWVNVIGELQNGKVVFPLATAYGVRGIPATFVVDKEGKIVSQGLRGAALEKQIAELVSGQDAKKTAQVAPK